MFPHRSVVLLRICMYKRVGFRYRDSITIGNPYVPPVCYSGGMCTCTAHGWHSSQVLKLMMTKSELLRFVALFNTVTADDHPCVMVGMSYETPHRPGLMAVYVPELGLQEVMGGGRRPVKKRRPTRHYDAISDTPE